MRRTLALMATTGTLLVAFALPASAHVEVTPAISAPGQLQLYTVQVPNELSDQATVEVDVTLPKGFELDVAQSVPGWETVITKQAGAPVSVAWKAGAIPVGTFASFQLQGRNPSQTGPLVWSAVQRYERTTVTWDGPESAENPAPVVTLTAGAGTGGAGAQTGAGQPATGGQTGAQTTAASDPLARSRAALAVALALTALALVLAPTVLTYVRRRGERDAAATPSEPDQASSPVPAARRVKRGTEPAAARGGQRRG